MDASFIPIEVVPSKTPFGLDQLRRSYKTGLSAEDAIAAAPAVGTADETFEFMFLMPISTPESAESATRIDLVYMGCLQDDGEGNPILPTEKNDTDNSVQSASSGKSDDGRTANPPISVQFYAPTSTKSYWTFESQGGESAADPTEDLQIITVTISDQAFTGGSAGIPAIVASFFDEQILEVQQSTEIVPAKYWQNVARKTKMFVPFVADVPPGPYAILESPGSAYTVGDTLTISGGGGTAVVVVDSTFGAGQIVGYHQTSNTCTEADTGLSATGGTGTGSLWGIWIVE